MVKQQAPDPQSDTAKIQTQAHLADSTVKLCEMLAVFIHEPMKAKQPGSPQLQVSRLSCRVPQGGGCDRGQEDRRSPWVEPSPSAPDC